MTIETRANELSRLIEAEAWDALAASLDGSCEPADVWLRTLAGNLAAIRDARPATYASLLQASIALAGVDVDNASRRADDAQIVTAFDALEAHRKSGQAIAVLGAGDGAMIRAIARSAPALALGREQEVNWIEPDTSRLIHALGQADLTGPRGPIIQERFTWYVGADWAEAFARDLADQFTKMYPQAIVLADGPRPEIEAGLSHVATEIRLISSARGVAAEAYYNERDDADLLAAFGAFPPRPPRVLMLTSRFTTVLQYSTYDSADAFRRLGWEVRVLSEARPWHAVSRQSISAAINDFKPDLLFQIDHLRYEMADVVPAKLPVASWIQDHLPNLTSATAGATIGVRDFLLTGGVYRYVGRYGYPRAQCIDMAKVSREPLRPSSWEADREDLVYVSHWSHTPESIVAEACDRAKAWGGSAAEAVMRDSADGLARTYAGGGAMRSDLEVRDLVRGVIARNVASTESANEQLYVDVLFQRLNNAYYRQQSLLWAARVADEQGLSLGIYGTGWERHPRLSRWARGPVKYGPELEALTRGSKILLQLEPYACFTHQRMLDALLAGGFALIRDHPLNALPIRVRDFLDAHVPADVNSVDEARRWLGSVQNRAFDALIAESRILTDLGDLVDVVRGWQRADLLGDEAEALPYLNDINFDSYDSLRDRVSQYVNDAPARRRVSEAQRASVAGRLTYFHAIRRALRVVGERLAASLDATGNFHDTAEAA